MRLLLLHICCAPCMPYVLSRLRDRFQVTGFFCNPNIQPEEEFRFREGELAKAAARLGCPVVYPAYLPQPWREAVRGLEGEPERGLRCSVCFHFRLRETFRHAQGNGFDVVATTLSISRHKSTPQIHAEGEKLESEVGIEFLAEDFKKKGGAEAGRKMAMELEIRHQSYCGCEFSRRHVKIPQ